MQTFNEAIWSYRRKVLDKYRPWLELFDYFDWLMNVPFIRQMNIRMFLADCEEYCWISEPQQVLYGNGIAFDIAQCKKIPSLHHLIKHYEGLRNYLLQEFPYLKETKCNKS